MMGNHIEGELWVDHPLGEDKKLGDLRSAPAHVSRVQAHLSDVVSVEQPAQEPFKAKTKPSMLASSKLPLISVPVVGGWVQTLLFIGGQQLVHVVHPHAPSHDLSHVGHQDVDSFGKPSVILALLHVEGLDVRGEAPM